MKRIKLLGLALIAVFALGAFASASAFAEEPELKFAGGTVPSAGAPAGFTVSSATPDEPFVTSAGGEVSCTGGVTGKGSFVSRTQAKSKSNAKASATKAPNAPPTGRRA